MIVTVLPPFLGPRALVLSSENKVLALFSPARFLVEEAASFVVSLYHQMKKNRPSVPVFRSQGWEHVLCLNFM